MTTIFGYPTIEAEIIGLINQDNADQGANFAVGDLALTLGAFDSIEARQRFSVQDTSGKYFGVIGDMGIFKRDFQTLFKGITLHVQTNSGLSNRQILAELCVRYGLPTFNDSDFAPGLLDMNTTVPDVEVQVAWPFAATSWGWTGTLSFYLSNLKNSLTTLIPDGDTSGLDPVSLSGLTWQITRTALSGILPPDWMDLDKVITDTDLNGLEYPGDTDLSILITVTDLEGLEYPSAIALDDLINTLDGLEYLPAQSLADLTNSLTGLEYPAGFVTGKPSATVLTAGIDFSDYEQAISRFRKGSELTDPSLVNVIVGKIMAQWPSLNTETNMTRLMVAFTRAKVADITTVRTPAGFVTTSTITLASQAYFTGKAVLKFIVSSQ